ncbi:MAG: hypothetical protein KY469_22620 [Actinobacteria bacterium]|nr:hypothetical protein [Actinomycetota bacterium]
MDSEWDEWQHDVVAFVLEALPSPPCRVLDVGCGNGWLVRALDGRDYDTHGVDSSGTRWRSAVDTLAARGVRTRQSVRCGARGVTAAPHRRCRSRHRQDRAVACVGRSAALRRVRMGPLRR